MNTLFPASSFARLLSFVSLLCLVFGCLVCLFFVSPCRRPDARLAPYGGAGRPLVLYATLLFNGGRFSCPVFPPAAADLSLPTHCCLASLDPAGGGCARARCRGHPAPSVDARPPRLPPHNGSTPHGRPKGRAAGRWPVDTHGPAPVVVGRPQLSVNHVSRAPRADGPIPPARHGDQVDPALDARHAVGSAPPPPPGAGGPAVAAGPPPPACFF